MVWVQLSLGEILEPAIQLAEEGFPVAPMTSQLWERGSCDLQTPSNTYGRDLLLGGRAPRAGEIMKRPHLANTFRVSLYTSNCLLNSIDLFINGWFGYGTGLYLSVTCI